MHGMKPLVLFLALSTAALAQAPLEPWQKQPLDAKLLDSLAPQVEIVPSGYKLQSSTSSSIGTDANTRKVIIVGETLPSLIVTLYGFPPNRIVLPNDLPEGRYDCIANLPTGSIDALKKKIDEQFGLTTRKEKRDSMVYLLKADRAGAPGLKAVGRVGNSSLSSEASGLSGKRIPLSNLATFLESQVGAPVLDETEFIGCFDLQLRWEPDYSDKLRPIQDALIKQLGLKLVPEQRPLEVLVVEKAR